MATLLLTSVGTLVGGPLGGAIGAFAGRQIDAAILGNGSREGPRLKDLAVTTSSYGQPIARHFGVMRVPGVVIWSTDLRESRETSGGGKGQPKTTTYSYSSSFAVALSSRPITDVGRIWADGDLLRGAAGDLKSGGSMRIYHGAEDQTVDSLIGSAEGEACPAFRDCAYVVFEDLELGDFGNRLPALTFEVFADSSQSVFLEDVTGEASSEPIPIPQLRGLSDEGGELQTILQTIEQAHPLYCDASSSVLECKLQDQIEISEATLPDALAWYDELNEAGSGTFERRRAAAAAPQARALRYYDISRDFQPGVQRSEGLAATGKELMIQFPGALSADGARSTCAAITRRSQWQQEVMTWRVAEINAEIGPGSVVRVPETPGLWLVRQWEWLSRGVELQLERYMPAEGDSSPTESGTISLPSDQPIRPTAIQAFELPWDGIGSSTETYTYAAVSSEGNGWKGAALYVDQAGSLVSIGPANSRRAVVGSLATALSPSLAVRFEPNASFEVDLLGEGMVLPTTSTNGLASGANRVLVDGEVLQYLTAQQIGPARWTITGLLRGRGGTESDARLEHAAGSAFILLDDALTLLDPSLVSPVESTRIAAIGLGDEEPVYCNVTQVGRSRQPLSPVHLQIFRDNFGGIELCWTRRARGQWDWPNYFDAPMIEEEQRFLVGYGSQDSPFSSWEVGETHLRLDATTVDALLQSHGSQDFFVLQQGTFGRSQAAVFPTLN